MNDDIIQTVPICSTKLLLPTLYIHVTYLVFTYTVANNFSDQLLVYNFIQLAPTYAIMEDLVDQMVCVDVLWTGQDQTAVKVSVKLHMSAHMATLTLVTKPAKTSTIHT